MSTMSLRRRDVVGGFAALSLTAATMLPNRKSAAEVPPRTGRVAVPGGNVTYWVVGEGRGVPILMVHGGPGGSHDYMLPLAPLGADRPVIFWDQLDCGESDHPNKQSNWTIDRFVAEIDPIRDALGLSETHIFGSSYGGLFAAEYAARQPKGLKSCILAGPCINMRQFQEDRKTLVKLLPREDAKAILDSEVAGNITNNLEYDKAIGVFLHRHMCRVDPWPDDLTTTFAKYNSALSSTMAGPYWTRVSGTFGSYDATSKLSKIDVPTFLPYGEFDFTSSGSIADFARELPKATRYRVADGSHLPWFESPGDYNHTVATFLSRVE
jgi:proline iminopeptidase